MAEIIQPMAFTVNPSSTLCTDGVLQLAIPQPWVHRLAELQGELRDRTDEPNTPGWRSLSAVIATLIPHLLTAPSYIAPPLPNRPARGGSAPWLLAHEPVSLRIIHAIMLAWLEKHYRDCPSYQRVRAQLPVDDLLWETMTLTLSDATLASKTANPSPLAFRALPALLADRLVRAGVRVPIVGERRQLVRMPVRAGGYGAELATWPPVYVTEEIEGQIVRFGMSYFFSLTLQTLAGEPEPRVHVHIGRRRWHARPLLTRDSLYLRGGRTSVYLRPTQPWLGLPRSSSFTLTQLVRLPQDGRWEPAWADLVPEIVTRLGIPFPMAADLARDPDRWIQGLDGVEAAIVARTPRNHPIGIGVDLLTRSDLLSPLAEAFGDDAHLVPTMHREPIHRNRKVQPLQRDLRELDASQRLEGFVASVLGGQEGANATIEVYWQSQEVRDWLVSFIKHLLCETRPPLMDRSESAEASDPRHAGSQDEEALSEGEADGANEHDPAGSVGFMEADPSRQAASEVAARLSGRRKPARTRQPLPTPPAAPDSCVIDLPSGGELRIVSRQVGAWAAPFEATERTVASVRARTQERMEQIVAELPQATEPTLALIELPNYRAGKLRTQFGRTRDPKGAIRLGMARVRRTSQFITPPGDGAAPVPVRAEKAVRDGLRHLGYLPVPIGFSNQSGPALPPGLMVAAVWSIRLTKKTAFVPVYLPVVVVMEIASCQIHAWLPDGRGLRPYRDALLDLTLLDREMVSNKQRPRALADLQQFLTQSLPVAEGANDLAILVVAQNARATWKGISNKDTLFDHLRFESNAHSQEMRGGTGRIRLIRLRTSEGHETPDWFIPGRDDTEDQERRIQSTQGLWRVGAGRNFYNIAAKPMTAGTKRKKGVQANPKEHHAIPSIVEIVPIITQEDEEVGLWARAVDQWRRMSYLTADMTLLPLPLHLAEAMEEYAQVIGTWLLPDALVDLLEENEEDEDEDQST